MSLSALDGLIKKTKKAKKPEKSKQPKAIPQLKVAKPKPEPQPVFHDNRDDDGNQIVRFPRVVPVKMAGLVEKKKSTGLAMTDPLGSKRETQERREEIVQWMLNGHTYEGGLVSISELAEKLEVPMETIEKDVLAVKRTFEKFYTEENVRDVTALAYMLMEMKIQDRGRALSIYNLIQEDIKTADENAITLTDPATGKKKKLGSLTGRDRAAMYSSALSALELANKAASGIDGLIKLSGGFQKIQQVIHAKNVQVNAGNGQQAVGMDQLQEFARNTLSSVLPSARKVQKLEVPAIIELTDEDLEIMEVGEKARGGK